ncbi:hypothetical protein cyc_03105 [Cyclospora cayetanensis]|uniref:Uncharacterized protein n=1 Tax=Cyclospora cayetanensis TaxID=88456 RepID=A0A1D3D479_9EIME|nr:hypothetical protein cyc_03105 [Cyclospora cayetanensis]
MYPWQEAYGGVWHLLPASLQRQFSQVSIASAPLPADPLAFFSDSDPAGEFALGAIDAEGNLWLGWTTENNVPCVMLSVFRSRLFPSKYGLVVRGRRHSRLFCPLPHKPAKMRGSLEGRIVIDAALGCPLPSFPLDGSTAFDAFALCSNGILHEFSLGAPLLDAGASRFPPHPYPLIRLRPSVPEPLEVTPLCFDLHLRLPAALLEVACALDSYWLREVAEEGCCLPVAASSAAGEAEARQGTGENDAALTTPTSVVEPVKYLSAAADFAAAVDGSLQQQEDTPSSSTPAAGAAAADSPRLSQQQPYPASSDCASPQSEQASAVFSASLRESAHSNTSASVLTASNSPPRGGGSLVQAFSAEEADDHFAAFQRLREEEIFRLYNTWGTAAGGAAVSGSGVSADPLQNVWCCGGFVILARASGRLVAVQRGFPNPGMLRRRLIASSEGSGGDFAGPLGIPLGPEELSAHHIRQVLQLHKHLDLGVCVGEGLVGRALGCLSTSHDFLPPSPPPSEQDIQLMLLQLASAAKAPYSLCCGPGYILLSAYSIHQTSGNSSAAKGEGSYTAADAEERLKLLRRAVSSPPSFLRGPPLGHFTRPPMRRLAGALWRYAREAARETAVVRELVEHLSVYLSRLAQQHNAQLLQALEEEQQQRQQRRERPDAGEGTKVSGARVSPKRSLQQQQEAQLASLLLLLLARVFAAQRAWGSPELLQLLQQQDEEAIAVLAAGSPGALPLAIKRRRCSTHARRAAAVKSRRRPPPADTTKARGETE